MRRSAYLFLAVMLILGVSACSRERIRRDPPDLTEPAPAVVTQTPIAHEAALMPTPSPMPALPTTAPTLPPTMTIEPTQPPSAAATAASEVDSILQDLEQLLRDTNTDVNVP